MTLTERLAAKVLSSLIGLLGKDNIDSEEAEAGFRAILHLGGKLCVLRVIVPERNRVVFTVELGTFTDEQNNWLRLVVRGLPLDFQLREHPSRTDAYLVQVLTAATVEAHLPGILKVLDFDMGQMDQLLSQMPEPESEQEGSPSHFRLFPEQPDPGYMRPPGERLH